MKNNVRAIWITFVSVFCVLLVALIFMLIYYNINYPLRYHRQILYYSSKYNLDASLVASVINAESGFNITARSNKGACGLMQIMPNTGKYIAENLGRSFEDADLYEAETNIEYGCYYLRYLYDKFKDIDLVLASYNAGEGVVSNWLKDTNYSKDGIVLDNIPYSQTAQYVAKVKHAIPIYQNKLT